MGMKIGVLFLGNISKRKKERRKDKNYKTPLLYILSKFGPAYIVSLICGFASTQQTVAARSGGKGKGGCFP